MRAQMTREQLHEHMVRELNAGWAATPLFEASAPWPYGLEGRALYKHEYKLGSRLEGEYGLTPGYMGDPREWSADEQSYIA